MSKNMYKSEYNCECGIDYGNCGKKGVFYLHINNSSDYETLSWRRHPEDPLEVLAILTMEQSTALGMLMGNVSKLKVPDPEEWCQVVKEMEAYRS